MGIAKMTNKLSLLLQKPNAFHNLSVAQLVEKILQRNEGKLTATGAVAVTTGKYTGRSPKDKYIVEEAATKEKIDWGTTNQPISEEVFENLYNKVLDYLMKKEEIFVFKGFAGADPKYRLPIQVVNELAWHNLFAHQLFIRPTAEELDAHEA
ncbi:phosphoenolpyruvate carboxykinase (ATP), partial [Parageobacillus thermoglucosidasius]